MRGTASLLTFCLLASLLTGCQQSPKPHDQLDAVLWTQTSIEHELLYRQVYAAATRQLQPALADPHWDALAQPPRNLTGLPPALIVDIDETLLDNSSYFVEFGRYTPATWETWTARQSSTALPGDVSFTAKVRDEMGGLVVLVTNREQESCADVRRYLTGGYRGRGRLAFTHHHDPISGGCSPQPAEAMANASSRQPRRGIADGAKRVEGDGIGRAPFLHRPMERHPYDVHENRRGGGRQGRRRLRWRCSLPAVAPLVARESR